MECPEWAPPWHKSLMVLLRWRVPPSLKRPASEAHWKQLRVNKYWACETHLYCYKSIHVHTHARTHARTHADTHLYTPVRGVWHSLLRLNQDSLNATWSLRCKGLWGWLGAKLLPVDEKWRKIQPFFDMCVCVRAHVWMFRSTYLWNVGHVSFRSTSSHGRSKVRSLRSYRAFSRRDDREGRRRTEPELYHSLSEKGEDQKMRKQRKEGRADDGWGRRGQWKKPNLTRPTAQMCNATYMLV